MTIDERFPLDGESHHRRVESSDGWRDLDDQTGWLAAMCDVLPGDETIPPCMICGGHNPVDLRREMVCGYCGNPLEVA